jgi:ankyrin repeat protein
MKVPGAICVAAWFGDLKLLEYLLDFGNDVNEVGRDGLSPIAIAITLEHSTMFRFF